MVNGQTFFNLNKNYDHIFSKSLTRKMLDLYDLKKIMYKNLQFKIMLLRYHELYKFIPKN